jgi:hypothetical protein
MALDYSALYPAQTDTDAAYPQGKAKNVSVPGAGDGTPWTANILNDIWGFLQALIKGVGATPSGSPDTATASQYAQSLLRGTWGSLIASNWTEAAPAGLGSADITCIAYSPALKLWVALGDNGALRYTSDFYTWTTSTIGGGTPQFRAVCWSSDHALFVAVGLNGVIYTSADGAAWTSQASLTTADLFAVAVKPGTPDTIVAVGADVVIRYSTNGTGWAAGTSAIALGPQLTCIAYSDTLGLFAVGDTDGTLQTSADGATWVDRGAAPTSAILRAMVWSAYHQKFIAAGGDNIFWSDDGIAWVDAAELVPTLNQVWSLTVDETLGHIIAVGQHGIASSFDIDNWFLRQERTSIQYRGVAFSQQRGMSAVVGDSGRVLSSLRVMIA